MGLLGKIYRFSDNIILPVPNFGYYSLFLSIGTVQLEPDHIPYRYRIGTLNSPDPEFPLYPTFVESSVFGLHTVPAPCRFINGSLHGRIDLLFCKETTLLLYTSSKYLFGRRFLWHYGEVGFD